VQFYENGFRAGNPEIADQAFGKTDWPEALPKQTDVLIVGCGPAGLTLAAQLSAFPDIQTVIIDQNAGPMTHGQADGIACRSVEMFEAFNFSEKIMKEGYWVNETTFWKPDPDNPGQIARNDRTQDTEDGLSEFPHLILNQARIHDNYLEVMERGRQPIRPYYGRTLQSFSIDHDQSGDLAAYPVRAELVYSDAEGNSTTEVILARFAVGCDGAHSQVRKQLGFALEGESVNSAWGVMDVLAVTDFPDIRMKSTIHSAEEGSMLIIPREGGFMVRLYIEIAKLRENERLARDEINLDQLIAAAQRIIHPFRLDIKDTVWWSVYQIGQRVCACFDDVTDKSLSDLNQQLPRVFICGDACHTHSPKAGQGMNVSMADAFNLGWKLAAVLRQQCQPKLLHSYTLERQDVAEKLIAFDKEIARLFSSRQSPAGQTDAGDAKAFQAYFQKHARYTAGVETRYLPGLLTCADDNQSLAPGLPIGMRFHSAPAIRLADGKPVHLGHCVKADGRWRVFAFARPVSADPDRLGGIKDLCDFLANHPRSPITRFTPKGAALDQIVDLRVVFQEHFRDVELSAMPDFLMPLKGKLQLKDYEKIFCADLKSGDDVFAMRQINRRQGVLVVVRPDQYISGLFPLDDHLGLASFFDLFMRQP